MAELSTGTELQNYIRAIVFGPPGNTKTSSSVTMSEKCPADWTNLLLATPPKRDLVSLDDLLWIQLDSQAMFGFNQLGVSAPTFDLSNVPGTRLFDELKDVVKQAKVRVEQGITKTIIVDTVSALDEMVTMSQRDKGLDKFDLYREILISHLRFASSLKQLKCNILFLCHAKTAAETAPVSQADGVVKAAESAARKATADGTGTIIPAITGAALNHYRRDVSFIFSISKGSQTVGGKPQNGFWFNTRHREFDTKSRLLLPAVLPADWREVKKWI